MNRINVGILGGGPSNEYEVSLATAKNVYKSIDRTKYAPHFLLLTRSKKLFSNKKRLPFPRGLIQFDVVFNALHGTFGEDGELQKILNQEGVLYTGSGARASKIGMDKWRSKMLFKKSGLAVPRSKLLTNSQHSHILENVRMFPVVVKPRNGGSSVGVAIARSATELKRAVRETLKGDDAMVEEYLTGKEFTAGVLEREGKPFALPVVEIRPKTKYAFFDYEAKYKTGASIEIVPARINANLARTMRNAALRAHQTVGVSGYSRSDFIVSGGRCYILEINTLPGLTKNSLVPKAAKVAGISFSDLIGVIIDAATKR